MLVVHVLEAILISFAAGAALGVCTVLYYFWRALFGDDDRNHGQDDVESSSPPSA